jgi:hypothetical protein
MRFATTLMVSLVVPCDTTLHYSRHWANVPADATPSRRRQPTSTKDQRPASIYKKFCFRITGLTSLTSLLDTLLTFCKRTVAHKIINCGFGHPEINTIVGELSTNVRKRGNFKNSGMSKLVFVKTGFITSGYS